MSLLTPTRVPELEPAGTAVTPPVRLGPLRRLVARFGPVMLRILVIAIGIFWLFPTLGLAVASLRSTADNSATGWWNVFSAPSQLTLHNYTALLSNDRIVSSLWNTVLITVPSTILVVALGAFGSNKLPDLHFAQPANRPRAEHKR